MIESLRTMVVPGVRPDQQVVIKYSEFGTVTIGSIYPDAPAAHAGMNAESLDALIEALSAVRETAFGPCVPAG